MIKKLKIVMCAILIGTLGSETPFNLFVGDILAHKPLSWATLITNFRLRLLAGGSAAAAKSIYSDPAYTRIQSLGVSVRMDKSFKVNLPLEGMSLASMIPISGSPLNIFLIPILFTFSAFDSSRKLKQNTELGEGLKPSLISANPKQLMGERVLARLGQSGRFPVVTLRDSEDRTTLNDEGLDGVLELKFVKFGLEPCRPHSQSGPRTIFSATHITLKVHGTLYSSKYNKIVWEHDELYNDKTCETVQYYQTHMGELEAIIRNAIEKTALKFTIQLI